tara:strand:+ start:11 stop:1540 length:1530 start_codon:yes stop_codon:yes gene_type:complete
LKNKIIFLIESKYLGLFLFFLGAIASVGFSPFNFFPITIFSYLIVIYFFTLNQKTTKDVFFYGFLFSLGKHLGLLYWIAISFKTANAGGYFAGGVAVLLLSSFLSIFIALAFYFLFKYFKDHKSLNFGIFFVFIFSLFDWLKGNILWGFPWTPISTLWSFNSATLYPFSILGVWGYCLITYSLIISFYYIFFSFKKALLFLFPFVFFILFLPKILIPKDSIIDTLFLRVVQPNIKQEDKWNKNMLKANYEKLTSLITSDSYRNFDLIILPETSINFDIVEFKKKIHQKNFGLNHADSLVLGAIRAEAKDQSINIFNSMYLIKNNYKSVSYHDKLKLVPFGEFIPFKKLLKLDKLTSGSLDFTKGKEANFLKLSSKVNILPLICYEVIFPKLSNSISGQYHLIINITNDAWYRNSSGPYQHFALTRIRAVMEGLTLIRAANTGISGIIGPAGNVVTKLGLEKEGVIDYKLNLKAKKTVYSIYRDSLFYLIMLTLFLLICISFFYNKNKRN